MDRKKALEIVKTQLTEQRYIHTLGVMDTAIKLAKFHHADEKKAEIAAIFHDYAKFRPKDEMKQIMINNGMPSVLMDYNDELWHAPVGAFLVQTEVGITDHEILDAIKYHTAGRERMTLLEKIIYVADYIEPGRHFQGVEEVRNLANHHLDDAMLQALRYSIQFLMKKSQRIFPATIYTYNDLILQKKGGIDNDD